MSKIMYKDKPYMSTTDLPEMTLTEARTGTEEEPRVISPKTLFEFAVNRLTGNIDLDTSAASGDDYNLTQSLTSLGWLSDVVTSGVLGVKKLLHKLLQRANIRQVKVEGSPFSVNASGTQWVTVPLPSEGKAVAVVGWYIYGGTACSIYNMQLVGNGAQFALRNASSTAISGAKITAYYLVVD